MLCYRDMTFCSANCATTNCSRQFTDEDRIKSEIWWKGCEGDPPVAFADFSAGCERFVPQKLSTAFPSLSTSPSRIRENEADPTSP